MNDISVIEKEYDNDLDYGYFLKQMIIAFAIVVIYICFVSSLVDNFTDYEYINQQYLDLVSKNYKVTALKKYEENRKEFEAKYVTYMIIIGLLSIIGGALFTKCDYTNSFGIGTGIMSAGFGIVFGYVYLNKVNMNFKVISIGLLLLLMCYFTIY